MRCTRVGLPILLLLPLIPIIFAGPFRRFRVERTVLGKKIHRALEEQYQILSAIVKATCPVYLIPFPEEKPTRVETLQSLHEDVQARHSDLVKANEVYESALRALAVSSAQDTAGDTKHLEAKSAITQDAYTKVLDARSRYHLAMLHFARHLPPVARMSKAVRGAKSSVDIFLSTLADQFSAVEASRRDGFKSANNRIQSILDKGVDIVKKGTKSTLNRHHRIINALRQDSNGNTVDDAAFLRALKVIANDMSVTLTDSGGWIRAAEHTRPELIEKAEVTENCEKDTESTGCGCDNGMKERGIRGKALKLWKCLRGRAKNFKSYLTDGKQDASSSSAFSTRPTASVTWARKSIIVGCVLYLLEHPVTLATILLVVLLLYFQNRLDVLGKFLYLMGCCFGHRRADENFLISRQRRETCTECVSEEDDSSPWCKNPHQVEHGISEHGECQQRTHIATACEANQVEKSAESNRQHNRAEHEDSKGSESSQRGPLRLRSILAGEEQVVSPLQSVDAKNVTATSDCDNVLPSYTPGPTTRSLSRRLIHEESSNSSISSRRSTRHQVGSKTGRRR